MNFYGTKGEKSKLPSMNHGTRDQGMMMVTSIEDLNITNLISGKQNNSEDINLKEVNSSESTSTIIH